MYELDLNSLPSGPVSNMTKEWSLVTVNQSPSVPQDEYRYASQFVLLPDGSLFFDGGYNENNPLVARNASYNPQNNIWTVLSGDSYNDAKNGGYRQISIERNAVQNFTYTSNKPLANLTYEVISELDSTKRLVKSIYGYNYVTELNLNTRIWTSRESEPFLDNDFPILIGDQTGTYHPGSKSIIFTGGFLMNALLVGSTRAMNYYITFDTESSRWGAQLTNGNSIPTPRVGHTATMLNTGNDILIYGGIIQNTDDKVEGTLSADYLYTLNLVDFSWTFHNNLVTSIGPRAFHSELSSLTSLSLYDNPAADILVANKTSTDSQSNDQSKDQSKDQSEDQSQNQTEDQSKGQSKGISSGAIAGIVVGVVAVIAIVGFTVFYHTKNKYKEEKMKELHVDWDEIENEYREAPPIGVRISVGSSRMKDNLAPPDTLEANTGRSLDTCSPTLTDVNTIKPDTDQKI
ncbi:hypothetical protein INT47_009118 [Mucor saturninus]|uniref:Galactose oxidase n=1 Tax=Mucor saturninus TaxID=64648 RepID=A0A8H7VGA2_9FUNG|nr:hypothetical protein INT47_009118 [Mucor saturninus]